MEGNIGIGEPGNDLTHYPLAILLMVELPSSSVIFLWVIMWVCIIRVRMFFFVGTFNPWIEKMAEDNGTPDLGRFHRWTDRGRDQLNEFVVI
jgi:hypothetical protein